MEGVKESGGTGVTGMVLRAPVHEAERKIQIQDQGIRNTFLVKNKANKLLKTQRSVPKSDKTNPISDTRRVW